MCHWRWFSLRWLRAQHSRLIPPDAKAPSADALFEMIPTRIKGFLTKKHQPFSIAKRPGLGAAAPPFGRRHPPKRKGSPRAALSRSNYPLLTGGFSVASTDRFFFPADPAGPRRARGQSGHSSCAHRSALFSSKMLADAPWVRSMICGSAFSIGGIRHIGVRRH